MRKISQLVIMLVLIFSFTTALQPNFASASTLENGFYINSQLDVEMDEFIKYSTKDKVQYLFNSNAYLIIGDQVLEAKLILTASDSTIDESIITIDEYEKQFGSIISPSDTFKVISID